MSLKVLVNNFIGPLGLTMSRRPDPALPNLHSVKLDGKQRRLWIVNSATKSWWMKPEILMNAELRELKRLTEPGDTVVEIGAHHGLMTLLLSDWVGSTGKVFAIEASSENAMVLDASCFENRLVNVTTSLAAVGKESGIARFGGESLAAASGVIREVPMVTLDGFCDANGIEKVGLLKIDVEGFEAGVLQGGFGRLSQLPKLALELHVDLLKQSGSSAQTVWNLLESTGMLAGRKVTMVCRPDWDTVRDISRFEEVPTGGVVNLFIG